MSVKGHTIYLSLLVRWEINEFDSFFTLSWLEFTEEEEEERKAATYK